MSMLDHSIRQFLEEAGAAVPTPGGGSVAALVGALGASMVSMTASFTQGKKFAEAEPLMNQTVQRMKKLIRNCEDLLEADVAAFERYMAAFKLPKATEEEKRRRASAIREAVRQAIEVPLRLMQVCSEALETASDIALKANPNVISDLGIGAVLFEAAAESAFLTAEINIAALEPGDVRNELTERAQTLRQEAGLRKRFVLDRVRSVIWKG